MFKLGSAIDAKVCEAGFDDVVCFGGGDGHGWLWLWVYLVAVFE